MSASDTERRTYLWDFFGPSAAGTAEHFRRHLDGFLEREGLSGCETGVRSERPGHHAVFCKASLEIEGILVQALRPQRAL